MKKTKKNKIYEQAKRRYNKLMFNLGLEYETIRNRLQ